MGTRTQLRHLLILVVLVLPALAAGGCAPTVIGSAATAAGTKAWEDRTTEDQITDSKIHAGILKRLQAEDKSLVLDIATDVWEQRVMVTGTVDSTTAHATAARLARADRRIRAFYDHIRVVPTETRDRRRAQSQSGGGDKQGFGQWLDDVWIETKIKGQLLTASGVTSVNYFWRSVLNDVYVIGRAKSRPERDKVLAIIRDTEGVRSVTQHIVVRPKK